MPRKAWDARVWPMPLPQVAPGVYALVVRHRGTLYVPAIQSDPRTAGTGAVGRWMDDFDTDLRVVFPSVVSRKLESMLKRRGYTYTPRLHYVDEFHEWVDGWQRPAMKPIDKLHAL